jgi:hypothetical protein
MDFLQAIIGGADFPHEPQASEGCNTRALCPDDAPAAIPQLRDEQLSSASG